MGQVAAHQDMTVVEDRVEEATGRQESLQIDEELDETLAIAHQVQVYLSFCGDRFQQ